MNNTNIFSSLKEIVSSHIDILVLEETKLDDTEEHKEHIEIRGTLTQELFIASTYYQKLKWYDKGNSRFS